jgi:hypothetical protein
MATRRHRTTARRATTPRRTATASRAVRSARGRAQYGLGITSTWKRANYAYPRGAGPDRGKRPSYPIDPRHVRAAIARASQRNTSSSRAAINRRLAKRYGSVANALAAARRATPSTRRGTAPRSRTRAATSRHHATARRHRA